MTPAVVFHNAMYRIADNHCIDRIKKRKVCTLDGDVENAASNRYDFNEFFEPGFSGSLVRKLLSKADKKDARIAILYYVDGLTQDEVANEMNCSRKTVKKRLKRFKQDGAALLNKKNGQGE